VGGEWVDRLQWHAGLLVNGELRSASGEDVVLVSPRGSSERYPLGPGSYLAPVILADVTPDLPIARQEIFGRDKSCPAVDKYTELNSTWIELAS
jgi:hypothetical protein